MRTLIRAGTVREVEKLVEMRKKDGWTPITPVKLDDSEITYNKVYYICVMEKPDHELAKKNRKWNRGW